MAKETPFNQALARINSGEFTFQWETHDKPMREMNILERQKAHETRQRMNEKSAEMNQKVREMLAELYDVQGHKNEEKLWNLAWEHGHSNGYAEIAQCYDDFVQLMK